MSSIITSFGSATTDGGVVTDLAIDVEVIDPDVDQTLSWRAYIDRSAAPFDLDTLAPSTDLTGRERRHLTFHPPLAPLQTLPASCHRIQLFVSSQFMGGLGTTPVETNDVASATWWVAVPPNTSTPIETSTCP